MEQYTVALKLSGSKVKVLLIKGQDELLRAVLPPPAKFWTGKPAKALLEALAIWLDADLRVVLDAEDPDFGFSTELTDELGTGCRTVFYEVVPVARRRRRRLPGIGNFRDAHQLCLLAPSAGGRS